MARLVVVSNRVPAPSQRGIHAGGLAVVLADALRPGALWFGWSGKRSEVTSTEAQIEEADGITFATVDLSEDDYRKYYVGFSNGALWPLLHLRSGLMNYRREDYDGYSDVNRAFAQALQPLLLPDDIIWIHDYQLMAMASELRQLGVTNRIGFFLHIPFVSSEVLLCLPPAVALLEGLCAADVIGFQARRDRDAFFEACRELLGISAGEQGFLEFGGRRVQVVVTPVGIDTEAFTKMALRAMRRVETRRLRDSLVGRALAIGADRMDYTKGLPLRFDAFSTLLHDYPKHLQKISFLQIAARSREDVDSYQDLRAELDRKTGDINGRFSDFDWVPLRYMTRALKRSTLAGLYRVARIGLVTPLRDGMNLVAKEFVAAQDPNDPGVLILSRFAGAAEEMTEALIVNPFDAEAVAGAMDQALSMSLADRQGRHGALLAKIRINTAGSYCRAFLDALKCDGLE